MHLSQLILTFFSLLLLVAPFGEAAVVSPAARLLQKRTLGPSAALRSNSDMEEGQEQEYIPLIIKLTGADALLPDGTVELYRRGDLALAYVPVEQIDELATSPNVTRVEGRENCSPALDIARTFTGLDRVIAAEGLPRQFSGRGVVVGFTDSGFDPNHIEFFDPRSGQSRVKLLTHYPDDPLSLVRLSSASEISEWSTDTSNDYHATHVAGILAGGYQGNGYYGIAPEAEIVASTSTLYDALMLAGMEDVVGYAKEQGKPAVINMSISCGTGPHDGTSLFSQYLERLAEDAVICISSGNDGMRYGLFTHTFTDSRPAALTLVDLLMASWYASGAVDVWSQDASPLNFAVIVYDRETKEVLLRLPLPEITAENPEIYYELPEGALSDYMQGMVAFASEINPDNGRFNATFHFDVYNLLEGIDRHSTRYAAGVEILGNEGQFVRAYASDFLYLNLANGYEGRLFTNGTINDLITGRGVIGVGALTSRNTWPKADGSQGASAHVEGRIADFSGYWREGAVNLPDIVAPGAHLVSALSGPIMESYHGQFVPSVSETIDGNDYHWIAACGTSMSSPYVAGVCALMLEANPDLTPAEVKEIIKATASAPTVDAGSPRWGHGVLDSYAAVKAAVDRASLPVIPVEDGRFDPQLPVEVYTLAGVRVATLPTLDAFRCAPLPAGLYLLRQGPLTQKHHHQL